MCRCNRKNVMYRLNFSFAIWCQIPEDIKTSICSTRRKYLEKETFFFTFHSDATAACGTTRSLKERSLKLFTLIWRSWSRWNLAVPISEHRELMFSGCMKELPSSPTPTPPPESVGMYSLPDSNQHQFESLLYSTLSSVNINGNFFVGWLAA